MTDLFELNINKYTIKELMDMLNLKDSFTLEDVVQNEDTLRERLLEDPVVKNKKKKDIMNFLDQVKNTLLKIAKNNIVNNHDVIKRNHKAANFLNPISRKTNTEDNLERSTINKMVSIDSQFRDNYYNTNASDFDYWEESGASGWGFPDVLPYFKRQENSEAGDESWRGKNGPLYITRGKRDNPLNAALVNSAKEAGFLATEDYNGFQQEGFGPADRTIWKGSRWSAANAYLKPALKTKKLKLFKKALVDRVIFSNNEAKGISFNHYGLHKEIYASKN